MRREFIPGPVVARAQQCAIIAYLSVRLFRTESHLELIV
jgi:hypothetical protein